MSISKEEIKKIAELSRLKLTENEEIRYAETISAVLEYMKILDEVDTTQIEPTYQVTDLENMVREDIVKVNKNTKELLKQMPEVEDEELVVPAVFE